MLKQFGEWKFITCIIYLYVVVYVWKYAWSYVYTGMYEFINVSIKIFELGWWAVW